MRSRVRVVTTYQEGTAPTGTEVEVISGTVTIDATADVRSTLDLQTFDEWGELVTPYGNELFVERGIDYGNGQTEWVSLGYFRIDHIEQQDVPAGSLRVAASDRMAQVIDQRLPVPVQFPSGTTIGEVFATLIATGDTAPFPSATIEFDDLAVEDATLGAPQLAEESRYEFLRDLATARGKVMYWDHRGVLVVRSRWASAVPTVVDSGRDGILVSLSRALGRDQYYNGVAASGESPADGTQPPHALAINDDPDDPLRWGGPFGKVPRYYVSSFITTESQAENAALNILATYQGLPYTVDVSTVPNPAYEPADIIRVQAPGGIVEEHVIESLTVGLTPGDPMPLQTRSLGTEDTILEGYGLAPYGLYGYGE
jgi:hypothetical protein